jgi:hypothetical protein
MRTYTPNSQTEAAHDLRELTPEEAEAVSGGLVVNAIIAIVIGLLLPAPTVHRGIGPV